MLPETNRKSPLVLHVRGVTGYGGGPEKTILNSPRFLRSLGYESVCGYMHPPTDVGVEQLRLRAAETEAEFISIFDRGPLDWRPLKQLIGYCRCNRVAIWHGHDYKSNFLGLIARRFWPMKLITTVHGWVQQTSRTPLYYAIDRRCLRHYDEVICVSDDLHRASLDCGVRPERCHLIQNAIDVDEFCRSRTNDSIQPTINKPLELGAMGRLSAEKGFDLLIQAVSELNAEGVPCRLKIAGEGDQKNELKQSVAQSENQRNVELLGQISDVKTFFERLDVFVLSSLREGLPNVLLEAMALGVPVVSTRVAGIPRLIETGENGILVGPGSVPELKNGIRTLANDTQLRNQLSAAGRLTIEQTFSFRNRMERIAEIYDRLLGRSSEVRPNEVRQLSPVESI